MTTQYDIFSTEPPVIVKPVGRFYNTTDLSKEAIRERRRSADSQSAKILNLFADHPQTAFSKWDVYYHFGQQFDRVSVGRAITDLAKDGYLVKTGDKVVAGPFQQVCLTWKFNTNNNENKRN